VDSLSDEIVAKGSRVKALQFGVTDLKGELQTVEKQKGRIVVVGFWSTRCDPSMQMLQEFRDFQAQAASKGMNLVFWPVHFEPWPEVLSFLRTKKKFFEGVEVVRLGLGEHGLSNLTDVLSVLPTVFLIDKEGGIAASWTGFQENLVHSRINRLIAER
jgi:thiol-disulfide isomerase/thioredoxin